MPSVASAGMGVMLPSFDPLETGEFPVVEAASEAERLGFDSVWAGDHLTYRAPVIDCMVSLAAVAGITERVTLGSAILLGALRPPALVATTATALDRISGGRLILGLGGGGESPAEYRAVGLDPRERAARVDDLIEILPKLWSGNATRFRGRVLDLDVPALRPTPISQPGPPIWVGGRSNAAVRRAAERADGWFPVWMSPDRLRDEIRNLHELAASAGRPRPQVTLMVFVNVGPDRNRCRAEAEDIVRGQYALELSRLERWCVLGDATDLVETVTAARAVGVDGVVLHSVSPDWRTQYRRWAEILNPGTEGTT